MDTAVSSTLSFRKVYNLRDPDARGRVCLLIYTVVEYFLVYITSGIFYTQFLQSYGVDITGVGILNFVPFLASMLVFFTPGLLNRFPKRRWLLAVCKFLYYLLNVVGLTLLPAQDVEAAVLCPTRPLLVTELNSPILARLDLIRPIEYMLIHHMDSWTDETRKILIYLPHDIPITEVKRHTALNVLAAGTQAASSALDNDFSYMDVHDVRREPLQQYKPVCITEADGCTVSMWQHKSDERLYFARVNASAPKVTPALMRAVYQPVFRRAQLLDKLRFDDYHLKVVVQDILD